MHGALLRAFVEQVAHTAGADADEHLDEFGSRDPEKRHACLAGDGARQQRLAGAGGPTSSTPRGMRAPSATNFSGSFRNSTTSWSS